MNAIREVDPADDLDPVRLLAVGVEQGLLRDLNRQAEHLGISVGRAESLRAALGSLTAERWNAVVVPLGHQPDEELRRWDETLRELPGVRPRVIALVPARSLALTLNVRFGGLEVLAMPVGLDQLRDALRRLCTAADEKPLPLPAVSPVSVGPYRLVSQSPAMLRVYRTIAQVAARGTTVLIEGESGTGKELVARAIHLNGPRATGPFVAVNCAAIPENLLESELFGHEKGAFTGAISRKIGRFERAQGGTLLLDEIGDMSLVLQSKILRAVQDREIERVGGDRPIPVDTRLIAATNCNLRERIKEARFREDLYYRLAVVTIQLPRLADRGDDLLLLTAHFLNEFGRDYGKRFSAVTDRALAMLQSHEWEGNVRELRNVVERAVLVAEGDTLRAEHLPDEWRAEPEAEAADSGPLLSLRDMEARHIRRVLSHAEGHIGEASRILGVHRNTLSRKIREYGL
jgi:DNA-binding NtrC family response regulator